MPRRASQRQGDLLTPRQLEVLELVAKGLTNKEIAGVLSITDNTVKVHVSALIEALEVTNRTEAAMALAELGRSSGPGDERFAVPGFGQRPAIAVLPFDNLSPDPDQEFFADGIVEDLLTRLAGWRWFPVLARNATWSYKGQPVDVMKVSREIGARYLVEGSVRRSGERVRLTAQVLDGSNGHHIWAERYDRALRDVFEVQDEIVESIVSAIEPALEGVERLRAARQDPRQLDSWQCTQRALHRIYQNTRESLAEAHTFLQRALELDPASSPAHSVTALSYAYESGYNTRSPQETLGAVLDHARQAVALDPDDSHAHTMLGVGLSLGGDFESARPAFERAIELNPSSAQARAVLGSVDRGGARNDEAITLLEAAVRLSPKDPIIHLILYWLGTAKLVAGDLQGALSAAQRGVEARPEQPHTHGLLAACRARLGQIEQARADLMRMLEIEPGFNLAHFSIFNPAPVTDAHTAAWKILGWEAPLAPPSP